MFLSLFKKIPLQRLIAYSITLSFLPIGLMGFLCLKDLRTLSSLKERVQHTQQLILLKEQKQAVNQMVKNFHSPSDHLYIDKHLETLPLLQDETTALEKILNSQAFTGDPSLEKRHEFLTKGDNRLSFIEGSIQNAVGLQETIESLSHTVEIDSQDLREILTRIEGAPLESSHALSPPQLLITEFKLTRKMATENNEIFLLNLKLLKREFL